MCVYLQEQCVEAAADIASTLAGKLASLASASGESDDIAAVEQALVIGMSRLLPLNG